MRFRKSEKPNLRPRSTIASLAWLLLMCAGLKVLPYASCLLEHVDTTSAARGGSILRLGSVYWDMAEYARDPKLQPLRSFYRIQCNGTDGIAAGICVSNVFAKSFPFGAALHDFCDRDYDPVGTFSFHMNGNPAHCVQRSALLAAILLSTGIPARVVQLLAHPTRGHTLVEIWDKKLGWILFDPSFFNLVGTEAGPCSASKLMNSSGFMTTWKGKSRSQRSDPVSAFYYAFGPIRELHFLYPEPWTYLRTGRRFSLAPFRGRYLVFGSFDWAFGFGQRFYQIGIGLSLLFAVFSGRTYIRVVPLALKSPQSRSFVCAE